MQRPQYKPNHTAYFSLRVFIALAGLFQPVAGRTVGFMASEEKIGQPVTEADIGHLRSTLDKDVFKQLNTTAIFGAYSESCLAEDKIKHTFFADKSGRVWMYSTNVPSGPSGGNKLTSLISEIVGAQRLDSNDVLVQSSAPKILRDGQWIPYGRESFSKLRITQASLEWLRTASTIDAGRWWTMPGRLGPRARCDESDYRRQITEATKALSQQ